MTDCHQCHGAITALYQRFDCSTAVQQYWKTCSKPTVVPPQDELKNSPEEITTMERLFKYSAKKFGSKNCLGTRTVLGELEEKQANGKVNFLTWPACDYLQWVTWCDQVFTKLQLGPYTWLGYTEVASQADCLGRGLREVGGCLPAPVL